MALRTKKSVITQAAEFAESVRPTLESAAAAVKDVAAPLLSDAKDKVAPLLAEGKAMATDKAESIRQFGTDAAAEPVGESRRGGRLKKLLLVTGLAALGAFLFKKFRSQSASDNWQSAYVPAPPPARPSETATDTAPATATTSTADDAAGASPDEAAADAAEEPHPVTTPDDPAEVVVIDEELSGDQTTPES